MGARKRSRADERKQLKKATVSARLNNCPSSPRKMRLVADMIRGIDVNRALDLLKHSTKSASKNMEKLVMSAVSNWQMKNENARLEDNKLIVKEIAVNQGKTLKRIRPAPQGRAYRVRKRSNHVTVILGNREGEAENVQVTTTENQNTK